jgi:hypothetical protein
MVSSTSNRVRTATEWLCACIVLALTAACGGGDGSSDTGPGNGNGGGGGGGAGSSGLTLLPGRINLAIGGAAVMFATGADVATTWQSSDSTVATVDASGHVGAVARGSAVISVSSGSKTATSTVKVFQAGGATPDPSTESLIAEALAQNQIDAETALTYRVFALFGDERLPPAFDGVPSSLPEHLLLREMATTIGALSPATQDILRPFLTPPIYADSWYAQRLGLGAQASVQKADALAQKRPLESFNCAVGITPSLYAHASTAHFNVYYLIFGGAAFAEDNANSSAAAALVASLIEDVYAIDTKLIDPQDRLDDSKENCHGADGKYDIYYGPLALGRVAAWTTSYSLAPDQLASGNPCALRPSFMMLNSLSNEFIAATQDPVNAAPMVKSILAHEFLHALQFTMARSTSCKDVEWFDEATAQWAMDNAVPTIAQGAPGEFGMEAGIGNVAENLAKSGPVLAEFMFSDHLVSMEKAGVQPKLNGYADYLFFQYLARTQGATAIKRIFDAMEGFNNSVESIAAAVDMKSVWPEFAKTLWIGYQDHVLDYWATEDEYRFGLAQVFAQVPTTLDVPQSLKDMQKTLIVDQKGQKNAKFDLLGAVRDSNGDFSIQPRSILYEDLKFSDATVHEVIFYNPIANQPTNTYMKVQALRKIAGEWQAPEDWTNDTYKTWCLDKKDERLEELLLIVSDSEADPASETPFVIGKDSPMRVSTSNVGCWQWKGTSSLTTLTPFGYTTVESFSGTFDRNRDLTADPADMLIGLDLFSSEAEGSVTFDESGPIIGTDCTIAGTATLNTLPFGDGSLFVNYLTLGPTPSLLDRMVIGDGGTIVPNLTLVTRCPGSAPSLSTFDVPTHWLSLPNGVPISDDGQTIRGTWVRDDNGATKTSVWNFQSIRE